MTATLYHIYAWRPHREQIFPRGALHAYIINVCRPKNDEEVFGGEMHMVHTRTITESKAKGKTSAQ